MPHRLYHVLDCVLALTSGLTAGASSLLMLADAPPEAAADLQLLLLPLIGSMIASCGMIMLSPAPETRRIVIGRAAFALTFGATGPQIIALFHPAIANVVKVPAVPLLMGLMISMFVYAVSKPFAQKLSRRSENLAERQLNELDRRFMPPPEEPRDS